MRKHIAAAILAAGLSLVTTQRAAAQAEPFLGQIAVFPYARGCPQNWAMASGQLMPIAQNTALFSLIGTTFGGDGRTTFGLPNLGARAPIGATAQVPMGAQIGSAAYQGTAIGSGQVTLSAANLPAHSHQLFGTTAATNGNAPNGTLLATYGAAAKIYSATGSPADAPMATNAIGFTGQGQPFAVNIAAPLNIPTQSPALALNYCIALVGIYPSFN